MRIFIFALLVAAGGAGAQSPAPPQLPSQLAPETRAVLQRLLDSARVIGIPAGPLADKAAEGVLKGADDRRIVLAVQTLMQQLSEAQAILGGAGGTISNSLLGAIASALQAGVPVADVRRLVTATPGTVTDSRPLVGALVTLVDLIAKHVSRAAASASIEDLLRHRATEDQFVAFRAEVAQDILGGQAPGAALATRMRAYVQTLDGAPSADRSLPRRPPSSATPPAPL